MTLPTVGSTGVYDTTGSNIPVREADFATVGVLGVAPNKASGTEYNRNYTVSTADSDLLTRFGAGDIVDQIDAITKGLPAGVGAVNVTVVAVPESESADPETKLAETIANLAGSSADKTGAYTFLKATAHQALVPRIKTTAGLFDAVNTSGLANPIVTALDVVNGMDFGFQFINGPSSTEVAAVTARELYNTADAHMIETAALDFDSDGNVVTRGASGYIAGLQAGVDIINDGVPSHVAGNRAINVGGPAREIEYSTQHGANEGQRLLAQQMGILVRGDAGADFAAGSGGTIYVGAHTLSDDVHLLYYNKARMRNYVLLNLLRLYNKFNLINNVDYVVFKNMIASAQEWLNGLADDRHIFTAPKVLFQPDADSPADWRLGKLVLDGQVEFRAPLMRTEQNLYPTTAGIEFEIAQLETFAKNLSV